MRCHAIAHNAPSAINNGNAKANGRIQTDNPWFTKPSGENGKPRRNKVLTNTSENDLASFLAQIIQEHPELSALIETWPALSKEIRTAILRIIGK